MAEQKTKPTGASVERFLNGLDEERRRDGFALVEIMKRATNAEPTMWGGAIVGFGTYHYKYASGHEGDCCIAGFSPRKQNWTLYLMPGIDWASPLLGKLGKHSAGKGCLYIKRLADVDVPTLEALIARSVSQIRATYPAAPSEGTTSGTSKAGAAKKTRRTASAPKETTRSAAGTGKRTTSSKAGSAKSAKTKRKSARS